MKEEIREKVAHQIDLFILGNEWTEESTNNLIDSIAQIMCPQLKPISGNTVEEAEKFWFNTRAKETVYEAEHPKEVHKGITIPALMVSYASQFQQAEQNQDWDENKVRKEAEVYANGAFGYDSGALDQENAFMSGIDWILYRLTPPAAKGK